ncbi:protein PSK SIMULATOR 1-like [Mercurialis annua]|uniref:protein PSK SIMULATOR 1-like n=1 Tax=Mercurialis annua TaxID=3986 RepID=UPI00215F89E1|nr:protein PSK SIMULATOR 1-like [Mercurialis annua]
MGTQSWFSTFRWNSQKDAQEPDKAAVGVLAFEVAGLMSKVSRLWHSLRDDEMFRLREVILNSVGIHKLVSDDENYLMDIALSEIMEDFGLVSRSVARLGKKCMHPLFRRFEHFVNDPLEYSVEWVGWDYRLMKMERKVKKMERFVAVTMQLSQELEVLAELEQTLRRNRANSDFSRRKLLESQQKVMRQRQEVRNMREMSPWIRNYDYIVRLLARSLLTILQRIMNVFEISQLPFPKDDMVKKHLNPACLARSHSVSVIMQSAVHPSENFLCGISSGPLSRLDSKSGRAVAKKKVKKKQQQLLQQSSVLPNSKINPLNHFGPFRNCAIIGSGTPILQDGKQAIGGSAKFTFDYMKIVGKMENLNVKSLTCSNRVYTKLAQFSAKCGLLNASSSTLGHAALALHYANLIIFIEKLVSSPYMIDCESRDDLYGMLPTTIRAALRKRLEPYGRSPSTSTYDASLGREWILALANILEWLSPLAHNMIKWQSERNFEREEAVSRTNILLVQTLHYADQAKTEAAIIELLVGLNYTSKVNQGVDQRDCSECSRCRNNYSYTSKRNNRVY